MASPVGPRHGKQTFHLSGWLFHYVLATPGVEGLDNPSVALDAGNEVQPDLWLRIESDRGGRSQNRGGIITGAPELVVEVADSSRAIDLGSKRLSYEQGHCLEYLVFTLAPLDILWHIRHEGLPTPVRPDAQGILRS